MFVPRQTPWSVVIRIDQRAFAGWFSRFGVNWPSSVCQAVWAVEADSKRPCGATKSGARQKRGQVKPVQLRPASVVFAAVVNRICFKALQLFGGVQWGLLPFACPSLKQLQQSFHASILRHHSPGSSGYGDLEFMRFRIV